MHYNLYALLQSIEKYFNLSDINVSVLHRYDDNHFESLDEIIVNFPKFRFIEESNFAKHVHKFLDTSTDLIAFLTDDIIFKEKVDVQQINQIMEANPAIMTFSLRLGLHI